MSTACASFAGIERDTRASPTPLHAIQEELIVHRQKGGAAFFLTSIERGLAANHMRYLLIHGAWHSRECFYKLSPLLQQAGHRVKAPDLPGCGQDKTSLDHVTLEAYVERVCQVLLESEEPTILVGHSLGGLTITLAAEALPHRVQTVVYLAAALIPPSETLLTVLSRLGSTHLFPSFLEIDMQQQVSRVKQDSASLRAFYSDCCEEDIFMAKSRLRDQPMSVYAAPLQFTDVNFGSVPRVYITCSRDPVIPYDIQKKMVEAMPCQTFCLETGHFPFFSAPEELARILISLATNKREM
jgi:pimeloyl-ACP methyl ester carboxylesterase